MLFRDPRLATTLVTLLIPISCAAQNLTLTAGTTTLSFSRQNFLYSFSVQGQQTIAPDLRAGLTLAGSPVSVVPEGACVASRCVLRGTSEAGAKLKLTLSVTEHHVTFLAEPDHPGDEVRFQTAGAAPAYGLADHAVEQKLFSTLANKQFNTDVTGFADDAFLSGQGQTRLVSNFIVYPQQGFAELLIDPSVKLVHTSAAQIVQGVAHSGKQVPLHYFFGTMQEIYGAYAAARTAAGYQVMMPKYQAFGVGWEAFGALGWETNQSTVRQSIDRYLAEGYPLRWVVIGSGFWPAEPPEMHETTSFGLWDKQKYPDPRLLIDHLRDEHLTVMLGLRITFIVGGPYSAEGVAKGYFLTKDGKPQSFTGGWPKLPYYLLDAHNPSALKWYLALVDKWHNYGIAGYKEDFYGYGGYGLRDDKVDPTNDRLMGEGQLIIERNGYLSSNGDLHRINDFNYNQDQDRGPVNALALAYSGFPFVYPDIVGGTFGEDRFSATRTPRMETYMMRNAQWAALHASMGMGEPPWSFSPHVASVMLKAATLHARIAPYLYSNARRTIADGYPWTMTPLPIAFPADRNVYAHEDATDRRYEWMIGDAMLATPLYGNDYETATSRDVYLPIGRWMDYETGTIYQGGQTLHAFPLPPEKTPLFIGGSGVTLEDSRGTIKACVYPVAAEATASLILPEGGRAITVHVIGLPQDTPWKAIRVRDSHSRVIAVSTCGHGYAFVPRAAESYTVKALASSTH